MTTSVSGEVADGSRLRFSVSGETYELPAASVAEILRPRPLARVPHAPPCLLGVTGLRGEVVPVLSAARMIGRDEDGTTRTSRVLVIDRADGQTIGLLVGAVEGLTRAEASRAFRLEALIEGSGATNRPRRRRSGTDESSPVASDAAAERQEDARELLGFTVAAHRYAFALDAVEEILPAGREPMRVADADRSVIGVLAHRGSLLPVVALGRLLGHPDEVDGPVIVVRLSHGSVGLAVEALQGIGRVPLAAFDEVPAVLSRGTGETRVDKIARGPDGVLVAVLSPARLFDETTEARLAALAGEDRQGMATATEGEPSERFVVFRLDDESYGLPISSVDEVVRKPGTLARLPRGPAFVLGVMSLRGKPVPVIDSRGRFGVAEKGQAGGRVIVLTVDGLTAGFAVDAVSEVLDVPASAIADAPDLGVEGGEAFHRIVQHDGRMVFVIEPGALLKKAERDALADAVSASSDAEATDVQALAAGA